MMSSTKSMRPFGAKVFIPKFLIHLYVHIWIFVDSFPQHWALIGFLLFIHSVDSRRVRSYLPWLHGDLWDWLGEPSGEGGAKVSSTDGLLTSTLDNYVSVLIWDTCQHTQVGNWNLDSWYKNAKPSRCPCRDHPTLLLSGGQVLWTCDLAIRALVENWFVYLPFLP